jgi:hypothetical protein
MKTTSNVKIERTTETGYKNEEYPISKAVEIINTEIKNKRTIWIDGRPFMGDLVSVEDINKCKNEISITNKLVGGTIG